MRMLFAASNHEDLVRIVRSVRRRWRLKVLLRGLGILLAVGVIALLISAYGMDYFRFDDTAVLWFRAFSYATLAIVAVRFVALPLAKRISDERVALYLEEHEPSLSGHVITGIEMRCENRFVFTPQDIGNLNRGSPENGAIKVQNMPIPLV